MSVFAGLDTEAYDRTYSDTELIKRIAGYGHDSTGKFFERSYPYVF